MIYCLDKSSKAENCCVWPAALHTLIQTKQLVSERISKQSLGLCGRKRVCEYSDESIKKQETEHKTLKEQSGRVLTAINRMYAKKKNRARRSELQVLLTQVVVSEDAGSTEPLTKLAWDKVKMQKNTSNKS